MSLIVDSNGATVSAAVNPADLIKESDTTNFSADVIEASATLPVIVDFWSPRSEPSQSIIALLEKAVLQAGGLIKMVKINIDENQELGQQLRVQSVPTVYAFKDGKGVDGFTGAQTESQIKAFIARVTGDAKSPIEEAMDHAKAMLDAGDGAMAEEVYMQVLGQDGENISALAGLIRAKVVQNDTVAARELVDNLEPKLKIHSEIEAAVSTIALAEQAANVGDIAPLQAAVEADPKNLQARLDLANALCATAHTEEAVDHLLECIAQDAKWNDEAARKQLLLIFDALGFADPVSQEGRRRLSTLLFS